MGLFKKKIVKKTYDREHMKPVIRASICSGEEVAGFKDIHAAKAGNAAAAALLADAEHKKYAPQPWRQGLKLRQSRLCPAHPAQ